MKKIIYLLLIAGITLASCNKEQELLIENVHELKSNDIEYEFFILKDNDDKKVIFYQETHGVFKQVKANKYLMSRLAIPVLTFNCESGNYRYYLDTTTFAWFELDKTELTLRRVGPETVEQACG